MVVVMLVQQGAEQAASPARRIVVMIAVHSAVALLVLSVLVLTVLVGVVDVVVPGRRRS
jgi:hypothetical protein